MSVLHVQPKGFWRKFNLAVRERNSGGTVAPDMGDNIQMRYHATKSYRLGSLQQWIESNCQYFVRSHGDDGAKWNPATVFEGAPNIYPFVMWTWETLKTAALGGNGWTAYPQTGGTTYRGILAGDIWKPILWEELARCFDMLIWTVQLLYEPSSRVGSGLSNVSFEQAKNWAVDDFNANPVQENSHVATYKQLEFDPGPWYSANISAGLFYIQAELLSEALVGVTGYAYVHTSAPPYATWDAQGETNIIPDVFHMAGSSVLAIGLNTIKAIGDLGEPPTWPEEPPVNEFTRTGWQLNAYFSLCEWAFTVLSPIT